MFTSIAPSDALPPEEQDTSEEEGDAIEEDTSDELQRRHAWSTRAFFSLGVVFAASYALSVVRTPLGTGAPASRAPATFEGEASAAFAKAIIMQTVTLELVWSDPWGRCLTAEEGGKAKKTPVLLQQCASSHSGQRFSLDSGLVKWEPRPDLCLCSRTGRSGELLFLEGCDRENTAQLWVLEGSSPHPALDSELCINATDEPGPRAGLVACSSIQVPTPVPTPMPTPAPTPVDYSWHCHHYEFDQSEQWCRSVGVSNGVEYKFFGDDGPCGECWCCKRPELPEEYQVLTDSQSQTPLPTPLPTLAPTPVDHSWQCHRYEEGQSTSWCRSVGTSHGIEYKFFGMNGPCGECWCCKRPELQVEHQALAEGPSFAPAPNMKFFGKGCCRFDDWEQNSANQGPLSIEDCLATCEVSDECFAVDLRNTNDTKPDCYQFFRGGANFRTECDEQVPGCWTKIGFEKIGFEEPSPAPPPAPPAPPAPPPTSWQCHRYGEGQDNEWCRSAGVLDGFEFKFFGDGGPCGECWCCKRPH